MQVIAVAAVGCRSNSALSTIQQLGNSRCREQRYTTPAQQFASIDDEEVRANRGGHKD
jgi:hypothetical protein